MATMDDYASIASYNESLTNFGTTYTFMQESMKTQATTTATMQGQLTNIQQFCMAVGQQPPHPTSMPLLSSSTRSTIAVTDAMAEATTTAVPKVATVLGVSHNNQPGLAATVPAHNNPHALPLPTSIGKIGTTAGLMVVTLMTPTQAHCVGIRAQHTTQMGPAPT
jgi:hypothetical protein